MSPLDDAAEQCRRAAAAADLIDLMFEAGTPARESILPKIQAIRDVTRSIAAQLTRMADAERDAAIDAVVEARLRAAGYA